MLMRNFRMSGPQILYGVRDGELVHIDDAHRGQACNCTCPQCGRALVARKGEILAHFFAHDATEVNCNPTPESLVHSYAKQQIAKMLRLELPGFVVEGSHQAKSGEIHELHWRYLPTYGFEVKTAEVESRNHDGVIPDVLLSSTDGFFLAVEVFFRHAVDSDKLVKLQRLSLSTVEIDLSDISENCSSAALNAALVDVKRWRWLNNRIKAGREYSLKQMLSSATGIRRPQVPSKDPITANSNIPSRLIADASNDVIAQKAHKLYDVLRAAPVTSRKVLLHELGREVRLALHCRQIGVSPDELPMHLMQAVIRQSAFGVPPILWQTGLFAKFCMTQRNGPVSAREAAHWLRTAFPGLDGASNTHETANGFNDYSEATYNFLNHLAEQGLMKRISGSRPADSRFIPVAPTHEEVRAKLLSFGRAVRRR